MSEHGQGQGRGEGQAGGTQPNNGGQWAGMMGQGQMQPGCTAGMGGSEYPTWGGMAGGQAPPQFPGQPAHQGQWGQPGGAAMTQGPWGQGAAQAQGQVAQAQAFHAAPNYPQARHSGQMGQGQAHAGHPYPPQAPMPYPYPAQMAMPYPYPPQMPMAYGYAPQAHMGYGHPPQGMGYAGPVGMGAGMAAGMGAGMAAGMGAAQGAGQHQGRGPGMSQLMEELAGGGNGLSSLTHMLNLDDKEMWKGALIGAAVVLLLTNESVQNALFKTGVRARDAVKSGVDKVKARAQQAAEEAGASKAPADAHE